MNFLYQDQLNHIHMGIDLNPAYPVDTQSDFWWLFCRRYQPMVVLESMSKGSLC